MILGASVDAWIFTPHSAFGLMPKPTDPHSSPGPAIPSARNPHCLGSRRHHPGSVNPYPVGSVPGPIARRPHESRPGGHWHYPSPHGRRHPGCSHHHIGSPRRSAIYGDRSRPPSWPPRPWPDALGLCARNPCGHHGDKSQDNHICLSHNSSQC